MKAMSAKLVLAAVVITLVLASVPQTASASFFLWDGEITHNELDWKYFETEHFIIYYYDQTEYSARVLSKYIEDIHDTITTYFNFEPAHKTRITIIDTEDYSNGFAAYNFDWITLWTNNLYITLRGRQDHIKSVFAHEYGHIVSLKAAAVFRENMIGLVVGGTRSSQKYNFDIGVGYFWGSENLPTWMVEGVAQYSDQLYGTDNFDTHREMLLRMAVLEDTILTMDQMDIIYDKDNFIQSELVYNQGYSMTNYIGETYGMDMNAKMWHQAGLEWQNLAYGTVIKRELGINRDELYNRWKEWLLNKYTRELEGIYGNEYKGTEMEFWDWLPPKAERTDQDKWMEGIHNLQAKYSPDGEYLAFASSAGSGSYYPNLYVRKTHPDLEEKNDEKPVFVAKLPAEGFDWSPDSTKIVYVKHAAEPYRHDYRQEIFVYDVEKEVHTRVTHQVRAFNPAWSPTEDKIAFTVANNGQLSLAILDYPNYGGYYKLVEFNDMTQCGWPTFSPDGTKIAFLMYRHGRQDIWLINSDGTDLRPLTYDRFDNRDASWMPDGKSIVFSSDRTGIFNVYKMDIETHELTQLTNVIGGAFWPWISPNGEGETVINYAYFTAHGFRLHEMKFDEFYGKKVEDYYFDVTEEEIAANLASLDPIPEIVGHDYAVWNGPLGIWPIWAEHRGRWVIYPEFMYEDQRFKAGFTTIAIDQAERNLVVGEMLFGEETEYHLWYENYMLPFTTFLSLHRIFPINSSEFDALHFKLKASFDAAFYLMGARYTFKGNNWYFYYFFKDIRVEQPGMRMRQFTGRSLNLAYSNDSIIDYRLDGSANPRGGSSFFFEFMYANPNIKEPFTGASMGSDLSAIYGDTENYYTKYDTETDDSLYPLPDYGYWGFNVNYQKYFPIPFWGTTPRSKYDLTAGKGWAYQWYKLDHTLNFKFIGGFVHSTVPEDFGWGNSYGRVHWYDRFAAGGMTFSGTRAYSNNGTFLGYERYTLEGETMAVAGLEYRFPIIRDIDTKFGPFYFDAVYGAVFGDAGNLWSHVNKQKDFYNPAKIFDDNGDGEFTLADDLLYDVGGELRFTMFLFNGFWNSFIKVAHGFQDEERDKFPVRWYLGLGTDFD
ncbi:MAG: DPP IV N-terminal domain-containing protein [Candidatus Alcyoniella australis]|nr:DPP IV N-terminal domain-containing protein [Candidatus Alcyoniella australis]